MVDAGSSASRRPVESAVAPRRADSLRADAIEAMPDPFALLEPVRDAAGAVVDFRVLDVNAAAAGQAGRARQDLVGAPISGLLAEDSVADVVALCARALDGPQALVADAVPVAWSTGSGATRFWDLRAVDVQGCVGVMWRDVTDVHQAAEDLAGSEARYRLLTERSGDMLTLVDMQDTITYVSPSVGRLLGLTESELLGTRVWDLLHPDDIGAGAAAREQGLRSGGQAPRAIGRVRRRDGTYLSMDVIGQVVLDSAGTPLGAVLTWRDVQAEVEARAALEESEARYRLLAEHSSDVVMLADDWLNATWVSPSTRTVLGRPPEALLGRGGVDLIHPDDLSNLREVAEAARRAGTDARLRFRWRHADGRYLWMEAAAAYATEDGRVQGTRVVHVREIDAQVRAEEALHRRASTDALTGLGNRDEALRRLDATLAHPPRSGLLTAVLFCDLDDLKGVNDRHGHAVGDLLLTTTAERIAGAVRVDDQVARMGGDEFLVVLTGLRALDDARAIAEKIRRAVAAPIPLGDPNPPVESTISIGITLARAADDVDRVIVRADTAMYEAKNSGGNAIAVG